ncbi:phage antirepressor KilAC domain-containing protein [Pseudomonas sp. Irchel s3a10]|jgi:phage antirepressor YoqD-like protein|uniref:phage antirepressor KilAC domain-containing protein n=1 Tax=Pseudomonas sp. Irchel s3a10 TaxID=2009045 RepID=UPI000BA314B2|nr:phage antirepressor KilAC domain-containing protein [Pseudomonas sp. Irchel s3a10]
MLKNQAQNRDNMYKSNIYKQATTQFMNKSIVINSRKPSLKEQVIPEQEQQTKVLTMSSRELSLLAGIPHDKVMMDICEMLDDQGLDASDYMATVKVENDELSFNLPKEEVLTLLGGYGISVRAKVDGRWNELESQIEGPARKPPTSLAEALKLAVELEIKRLALTNLVKTLEEERSSLSEKVEFYDDIANTSELFNTGVIAKSLDTGKIKLINYLYKHKILMGAGNKRNLPYQKHLDAGRLKVKWITGTDRRTGERYIKPVPLFTGKGIIWIHEFIEQKGRLGL